MLLPVAMFYPFVPFVHKSKKNIGLFLPKENRGQKWFRNGQSDIDTCITTRKKGTACAIITDFFYFLHTLIFSDCANIIMCRFGELSYKETEKATLEEQHLGEKQSSNKPQRNWTIRLV